MISSTCEFDGAYILLPPPKKKTSYGENVFSFAVVGYILGCSQQNFEGLSCNWSEIANITVFDSDVLRLVQIQVCQNRALYPVASQGRLDSINVKNLVAFS